MRTFATLRELVFAKFLINGNVTPNPVILPNGNERWYIVQPTQTTVQIIIQTALTNSNLPYAVAQVNTSAMAFVEFKKLEAVAE